MTAWLQRLALKWKLWLARREARKEGRGSE
jgi:hypothetical protein